MIDLSQSFMIGVLLCCVIEYHRRIKQLERQAKESTNGKA